MFRQPTLPKPLRPPRPAIAERADEHTEMNDPRFDYLARNRDHIERVCIECVQQAVNEQAPDPIARVGELLLQQASNASTAPPSSASRIAELEKALTMATTQLATATTELATANARIAELEAGKGPVSTDAKRGPMHCGPKTLPD